ncbi:RNA methyltransferase [Ruficoccus sp. ZRK36]|uniref:TrmH family RNA methyltransferase n=1 Tax=Ruficoccus sp. ZRK36 TaxID=2866311 RepID=UPI001C72F768|nr:RNA methyltransferase [Ruficoccus sp. ZRK36]QYY36489.1 RNA methyltransferase [Ruficoccus sp. ZRK36]
MAHPVDADAFAAKLPFSITMPVTEITSRQNPRLKQSIRLRERKGRLATGQFLVEGRLELARALEAGLTCVECWQCPEYAGYERELAGQLTEAATETFRVPKSVFEKLAGREGPDGLIAVFEAPERSPDILALSEAPLIVLLEGVEKPGNLGAIIRSAEIAGADAVIVSGGADLYNPHAIRNSRGLVFTFPVIAMEPQAALAWMRARGIKLYATTPAATLPHWSADLAAPSALLMGSEAEGLSDLWLKEADASIQIPLQGHGDSLNVSVSAAVVLFEAVRQRQVRDRTGH